MYTLIKGTVNLSDNVEQAKGLLDLARRVYPDTAPDIEKAIAAPRDS